MEDFRKDREHNLSVRAQALKTIDKIDAVLEAMKSPQFDLLMTADLYAIGEKDAWLSDFGYDEDFEGVKRQVKFILEKEKEKAEQFVQEINTRLAEI